MKKTAILILLLQLVTSLVGASPNTAKSGANWQKQLASYLYCSENIIQSLSGSVVVVHIALDAKSCIRHVTVFSQELALNTLISKQLLGKKIHIRQENEQGKYTIRLHFPKK